MRFLPQLNDKVVQIMWTYIPIENLVKEMWKSIQEQEKKYDELMLKKN